MQVVLIDLATLKYKFERENSSPLHTRSSEGYFHVATFSAAVKQRVMSVIENEPAPSDGKGRCQDWIVEALISLEAEELVPSGTSEWIQGLVGRTALDVEKRVGEKWVRSMYHTTLRPEL